MTYLTRNLLKDNFLSKVATLTFFWVTQLTLFSYSTHFYLKTNPTEYNPKLKRSILKNSLNLLLLKYFFNWLFLFFGYRENLKKCLTVVNSVPKMISIKCCCDHKSLRSLSSKSFRNDSSFRVEFGPMLLQDSAFL